MELIQAKVETVASASLPWDEAKIMPLGDVQLGAEGCDEDRFKRHVEWGMKQDAYFLGMGDYVDVASPSNRLKIKQAALYDSVNEALEEQAQVAIERFLKLVKGTEGRWLGLLSGHHYWEFQDGSTSDTRLAQAMKSAHLGSCAFVRLQFAGRSSSKGGLTCTIWCHHGQGGGIKQGAPLNKLENLIGAFDADIYLMAHMHKKVGGMIDQLYMTRQAPFKLRHRTKLIAGTGGFLRGYLQGSKQGKVASGNYVEKAMMGPVALGGILIKVRPVRDQTDGNDDARLDIGVEL